VCGRQESLAGAPGNLLNFVDSPQQPQQLAPFTSTVFGGVSDALCSAVGFGPGAGLQFQPGGAPPATPTPTPTPAGVTVTIPGLPSGATVTVTGPGGAPVITTSTSVSGNVATFPGPFTIPFGGQIRVTPAISSPSAITVGSTTINTFDNTTNPGSTTYFTFGTARLWLALRQRPASVGLTEKLLGGGRSLFPSRLACASLRSIGFPVVLFGFCMGIIPAARPLWVSL